jgi:hypothetical protein
MLSSIFTLDLARGIKDMLIANGFTSLDAILRMPPAELALILGIDLYVARLIYLTAKRHGQIERLQRQINDEEMKKPNIPWFSFCDWNCKQLVLESSCKSRLSISE